MKLELKKENDKIGFINELGEIVIPINFKNHYGFETKVKLLKMNNEYQIFIKQECDRYYYNIEKPNYYYIENCVI